ncbi:hypothetical protein WEI85_09205 [Actinomycetes bacterium KLBMP 9797]
MTRRVCRWLSHRDIALFAGGGAVTAAAGLGGVDEYRFGDAVSVGVRGKTT